MLKPAFMIKDHASAINLTFSASQVIQIHQVYFYLRIARAQFWLKFNAAAYFKDGAKILIRWEAFHYFLKTWIFGS